MTVDEALAYVGEHLGDTPAFATDWEAMASLAAEVRRLRELLDVNGGLDGFEG